MKVDTYYLLEAEANNRKVKLVFVDHDEYLKARRLLDREGFLVSAPSHGYRVEATAEIALKTAKVACSIY